MFLISVIVLSLSTISNSIDNEQDASYGFCHQLNVVDQPQIIPYTDGDQPLSFKNYGFELSSNNPINCIWFPNQCGHSTSTTNMDASAQCFEDRQQDIQQSSASINCNHQQILLSADNSDAISKHLCGHCNDGDDSDEQDSCSLIISSAARTVPDSMHGSDVSPLIPSMFGISGIVISFIILCSIVYCFAIKYSKWTDKQTNNETEEVIGDVLDEIAKYTIGDSEEEGFYGDWIDPDSDRSSSSLIDQEQLGMTILKVVSTNHLPEMNSLTDIHDIPNPSIIDTSSSSESSSENEFNDAQDLLVAKQVLNTNYQQNEYTDYYQFPSKLKTIQETKRSALLSAQESDYKLSSDAACNSDLP